MTDTLELLQNQKQAMEADRAKLDADINDLDAAIKAIKSRRDGGAAKPKTAPKKAATPKKPGPKPAAKKPAAKAAPAKKPAPAKTAAAATATKPAAKAVKKPAVKVTLDDAIIKAVGMGKSTPVMILDHVTGKMSIDTTINSIRTRVSRLKRDGKLLRGKEGWSLPAG